jgi:glucosylceramidase
VWQTGAAQQPGQWLQVDLGAKHDVRRLVLDTGASTGDYPRGYQLYASRNGQDWGKPVASGSGSGQLTTIDVRRPERYLRVVLTSSAPSWWTVADLRAYR